MLKLVRVQILGFKSFCDRTELSLSGRGIVAVVGPNGCGKSNISDAITWVLGEQSAKSLRGIKMEDVIFAGTRERRPTGMAEVSLTLVDPDVYDDGDALGSDGPELVSAEKDVAADRLATGDWDEDHLRAKTARATESAVRDAQPGVALQQRDGNGDATSSAGETEDTNVADDAPVSDDVVLKIRRRRFRQTPVRAGEVTVTRRLFRTGDSEYLLNGRICRLRDIQDIFLGTGLGGESYAIIGQERIGQLLSSKPLDRRGIIEEAAGITRFKTKKRLAELRLESAKGNLSRVNDIFDEVARQMTSLKRQAAKAERYGALRDELRTKLRIALHSRMAQLDHDAALAAQEIQGYTLEVDARSNAVASLDAEHAAAVDRGYALDGLLREAQQAATQSAVELERLVARETSNTERIAELLARLEAGKGDLAAARDAMAQLEQEANHHRSFLDGANVESAAARGGAEHQAAAAIAALRAVQGAEHGLEHSRRAAVDLLRRAAASRSEIAQAEAALAGLAAEAERLDRESAVARDELASLGLQHGQIRLSFESVTDRLQRLEAEIAGLRLDVEQRRRQEGESKRTADTLRSELASLNGRRSSLEGLIRDHSYSTDTVKNIFRKTREQRQASGDGVPLGTLADFLELETQFGSIVDEFLREELNFIVVQGWDAAERGIRLLRADVSGRATFLLHPPAESGSPEHMPGEGTAIQAPGLTPLRDCIRVLNGLSTSLHLLLPKLRDGYVATDAEQARNLAAQHPHAWFLAPTGEVFHALTVAAGRAAANGPLALKRDLRELSTKTEAVAAQLAQADLATSTLTRQLSEANGAIEQKTTARREAEREAANSGAALRQMDGEAQRLNRRMAEWQLALERNRDQRRAKEDLLDRRRSETAAVDQQHTTVEATLGTLQHDLQQLRAQRDELQVAASAAAAALAGLEERRRNAQSNFDQTSRLLLAQKTRLEQLQAQLTTAAAERARREGESRPLAEQAAVLRETHATATDDGARLTAEAKDLRRHVAEFDGQLRTLRKEVEALREQRADVSTRAARLAAEIEHANAACLNDLNLEPEHLRADITVERSVGEALLALEAETRTLKGRLEAMGPVNMMALEEFHEASERHTFLDVQRKDLLDSITNTQASIREIDEVSRAKFEEAFKAINQNFSVAFTKLFGGGQAMMRLTDEENAAESGVDIIASPPGKKLQSILLLSGGEKALTALSLLVSIFQFQPAPFCILDEVDAPLDDTNVGRFARLIADMGASTQFIVITHSKRTMEQAEVIYGVTMQEPGVSKVVSVNLSGRRDATTSRRAVA